MVRGAVVGCGDIVGEVHMPAWHAIPEVRLDAVCDTNSERRMAFACKHNLNEKSYSSMHDLLEKEPDLNFVTIATPGFTHYELCREAIDAGVHVLVEKPLTLRMEEALDLQERAQKQGVKVCVGHTYRFREPVIRAKEACEQGLVGEIYQVNVIHHGESLFHASEPPWRYKEHENKVLLYELAIHFLDLQVYFAGPVREILFLKADYNPHLKANTRVYALVEHTSGAVGIVDYQVFASSNYSHFEIFGTANDIRIKFFPHYYRLYSGRINPLDELYYDFLRIKDFVLATLSGRFQKESVPRRALPHYRLFRRFVNSLLDDSLPVPVSIENVLPTMEFLEMLRTRIYGS